MADRIVSDPQERGTFHSQERKGVGASAFVDDPVRIDSIKDVKERLRDLNTKGYYLLVALGFIYYRSGNGMVLLKWAIVLTAIVSVFPIQDYIISEDWLKRVRDFKVLGLIVALILIIRWLFWYN